MKTILLGELLLFASIVLFTTCQTSAEEQQHRIFQDSNQHRNKQLNIKSLLEYHDKPNLVEAHTKKFHGETLAYVTPWNNRGKEGISNRL